MNLFETLTKTIGILKLLNFSFEYIKDYSYNNLITKKEVSQKSSNVIKFKKKA